MTETGKPPDSVSSASRAPCPITKIRQPRSKSHDTSVTISGTPRSDEIHDTHDSTMPHTWHGVRTHRTEDRVIRFLRGLNDSYASVRSQIMLIEPMPNMSRVFSLVVQQERQLGNADSEGRALAVGTNWRGEGDTMDICYRLHGFPTIFKFTRNQHANSATTTNQDQIHEMGNNPHIGFNKEEYRRLQNMPPPTRNTNEQNTSTILSTMAPDVNDNSEEGMTKFQSVLWILDSGATDHISCCLSLYSCHYKIKPIKVIFPNGHTITASISRTIPLNDKITIHNVLFIPTLAYNLLSIPKLTMDSSYTS
ncbi:hypothetical protein Lal_00036881 [Lupinus albus]|nr:hypothetical protein Lal_00036881 [Lupinus albus]